MKNKGLIQKDSPMTRITKVAAGVALAVASASTQAVEFETDSFDISFDSTFSLGASWRVEDRDRNLIGKANLYELETGNDITLAIGACQLSPSTCVVPDGAWSNNSDDGNLNFDKGDMFSNVIKGTHELDIRHKDGEYGIFARGLWYYDRILMDTELPFRNLDSYPAGAWANGDRTARDQQGREARMLDAYAWATWDVGEASTLQVRLGEQVVSWGESTFIQHSLNEANAVDLRTLRNPGAELKEAFIPAKMLWASLDLSESIALEAFYQFEWEPVRTDEPGTYFATRDFLGRTGYQVHLGFAQIPEGTPGTVARRVADRPADDNGQYGLKMAYFTEGGTEFGFYYMNYHNRRPIISANVHNGVEVQGFLEYPEDIRMSGISFNTATDGGLSVAGELSYRQDEPLQVDDAELLFATLAPVLDSVDPNTSQLGVTTINDLGREISGYRLHDTIQGQITFTNLLGSTLGSDETAFVFELGANYIRDLPNQNVLRYEVEGTLRSGNPDRAGRGAFFGELEGLTENEFANTFSWGYRTALRWNYNNMFAGWNMAPRLVYQHDVKGNTPAPISNFLEGRKALSLGVSFDYQSTWKIDFAYNRFFGAESANLIHDRDYVSLAFSYSI